MKTKNSHKHENKTNAGTVLLFSATLTSCDDVKIKK